LAKAKASILVDLNEKPAIEGLKNLTRAFKKNATDINQSLELLKKGYGAVAGAIGLVAGAITTVAKAAMEAEKIERRAIAALSLRGKVTQENIDGLKSFNNALQQSLGIDGDNLLQLQGTLSAMGVRTDKLKEATKQTIGLAAATGKDLNSAVKAVAGTYNGKTAALSKVGIVTKDVGEAQKKLSELFKIAEAQGGTLESRVNTLSLNYGDLEETLGQAFTRSSALNQGIGVLSETLATFVNIFGSEDGQLLVDSFFRTAMSWTASLGEGFLGLRSIIKDTFGSANELFSGDRIKADLKQTLLGPFASIANSIAPNLFGGVFTEPITAATEASDKAIDALQTSIDRFRQIGNGKASLLDLPKVTGVGGSGGNGANGAPSRGSSATFGADVLLSTPQPIQVFDKRGENSALDAIREPFAAYNKVLADESEILGIKAQSEAANAANSWIDSFGGVLKSGVDMLGSAIGQTIGSALESAFSSGENVLAGMKKIFGSMLVQMGTMLVQLGTVALLANALSFIPFLAPIVGPPGMGAAAAAVAIAGGAGLIAVGSALGGSGGGSSARTRPSAGASPRSSGSSASAPSAASSGFNSSSLDRAQRELRPIIINYNAPVLQDERRSARMLDRIQKRGSEMRAR
jgi:hypothetical protein